MKIVADKVLHTEVNQPLISAMMMRLRDIVYEYSPLKLDGHYLRITNVYFYFLAKTNHLLSYFH